MKQIEKGVLEEIARSRQSLLANLQAQLGTSPEWRGVRASVLKAFGDRGLSGRVTRTFAADSKNHEISEIVHMAQGKQRERIEMKGEPRKEK